MTDRIKVKDREFRVMITRDEISSKVKEIAERINADYEGKAPLFLCMLNGSFVFAADLLRQVTIQGRVSFVKYASYSGLHSTQYVKHLIGLNESLTDLDIVIVEDIIDTGTTMDNLLKDLKKLHPASVRIASLCFKPTAFRKSFKIDYLGFSIPADFIVGYGLDYDGLGRNLPEIYKIVI